GLFDVPAPPCMVSNASALEKSAVGLVTASTRTRSAGDRSVRALRSMASAEAAARASVQPVATAAADRRTRLAQLPPTRTPLSRVNTASGHLASGMASADAGLRRAKPSRRRIHACP